MAAVTYGAARGFITYSPKLHAELARQSLLGRGFRLAGGLTALAIGMLAIVGLHLSPWEWLSELLTFNWTDPPPPVSPHFDAVREAFPIDQLEALRQKPGEVLGTGGFGFRGEGRSPSPESPVWIGVFALWALMALVFIYWAASIAFDTRRNRHTWKNGIGPSLVVTLFCVSGLTLPHFARVVQAGGRWTYFPVQETRAAATTKQLEDRLYAWADSHELKIGIQYWDCCQIVPSPDGDQRTNFSVRMFELRPVSMWSLWRVTWGPVLQPLPPLNITSVSLDDAPDAYLSIDSGKCSDGTGEKEMWMATIQSLQRAVTSGESD